MKALLLAVVVACVGAAGAGVLAGAAIKAAMQTATPTAVVPGQGFEWTQDGQDVATAQGYEYWAYVDTVDTSLAVQLMNVTCRPGAIPGETTCASTLPPMTPGADHILTLTQYDPAGNGRESAHMLPWTLRLPPASVVTPRAPRLTP